MCGKLNCWIQIHNNHTSRFQTIQTVSTCTSRNVKSIRGWTYACGCVCTYVWMIMYGEDWYLLSLTILPVSKNNQSRDSPIERFSDTRFSRWLSELQHNILQIPICVSKHSIVSTNKNHRLVNDFFRIEFLQILAHQIKITSRKWIKFIKPKIKNYWNRMKTGCFIQCFHRIGLIEIPFTNKSSEEHRHTSDS